MTRKILIIGGNRFFGRRLTQKLIENGDAVTLLNRGQHQDDFGSAVQRIVCDRKNSDLLSAKINGQDWDIVYDQVCYDAHEAKAACDIFTGKTNRYIFTSSQSVYESGQNLAEISYQPQFHQFTEIKTKEEDYSEAKRQCEAVFFEKHCALSVCAVRFPIVIGPDDYTERLKFHVQHVREGRTMAVPNLNAKISFIHSADAAEGLFLLGKINYAGPLNMASLEPVEVGFVIQEIEEKMGKKAIIDSKGDPSPYGIKNDWFMNIQQARSMGFKPRPVHDWLREVIGEI